MRTQIFDDAICRAVAAEALTELDEKTRAALRDLPEADLIKTHFGLGMWLRNSYFYGTDRQWVSPEADRDSQKVIRAMWRRLQGGKKEVKKLRS